MEHYLISNIYLFSFSIIAPSFEPLMSSSRNPLISVWALCTTLAFFLCLSLAHSLKPRDCCLTPFLLSQTPSFASYSNLFRISSTSSILLNYHRLFLKNCPMICHPQIILFHYSAQITIFRISFRFHFEECYVEFSRTFNCLLISYPMILVFGFRIFYHSSFYLITFS